MAATSLPRSLPLPAKTRVFARSVADAWLVAVALAHGLSVAAVAALDRRGILGVVAAAFVALATVYVSNTVAHWHLHAPIFTSRRASRALSLLLSMSLSSFRRRRGGSAISGTTPESRAAGARFA